MFFSVVAVTTFSPSATYRSKRIVGGNGTDTLRLDGSGLTLDLTSVRDNRLQGIEVIDLTGSGNNTLTLTAREVLNLSDSFQHAYSTRRC